MFTLKCTQSVVCNVTPEFASHSKVIFGRCVSRSKFPVSSCPVVDLLLSCRLGNFERVITYTIQSLFQLLPYLYSIHLIAEDKIINGIPAEDLT